jgi:hypothetical protein
MIQAQVTGTGRACYPQWTTGRSSVRVCALLRLPVSVVVSRSSAAPGLFPGSPISRLTSQGVCEVI